MIRAGLTALALLLLLAAPGWGQAQPEKKATIRWFGQSFFQLELSSGIKIVFDPHAIPVFGRPAVKADIVLVSHPHTDHNQVEALDPVPKAGDVYYGVEDKKGRQEWKTIDEKRGQIRIRTVASYHDAVNGMTRGKNSIWIVEADGLIFCHLGDLGHELTDGQLKAIGKVDVLMIPVGGIYTINGDQAKKVVAQIKPTRYILPMHYGVPDYDDVLGPDEFLEDQKVLKMMDTNMLVIPLESKPPETPTVILLGWRESPAKKP